MALLIKETQIDNWGTEPLKECICSECNSSIIEEHNIWPSKCWYCNKKLPRMYRHFYKRKMARWLYYMHEQEIPSYGNTT